MFQPTRDEVRRFFCECWRKHGAGEILTPLEDRALTWILLHPEYHAVLDDLPAALATEYSVERGQSNPFLHLSMHVALDEQLAIDQPAGVREAFTALSSRADSPHDAAHEAIECLGRIVWEAQRGTGAADAASINDAYLTCLRQRASR
jgi:hypothetical protein